MRSMFLYHLKDTDIWEDIKTSAAEERGRQEEDFQWDSLPESGKVEKRRVRYHAHDLYLKARGLTTIRRKPVQHVQNQKTCGRKRTVYWSRCSGTGEWRISKRNKDENDNSRQWSCLCGFGWTGSPSTINLMPDKQITTVLVHAPWDRPSHIRSPYLITLYRWWL